MEDGNLQQLKEGGGKKKDDLWTVVETTKDKE